MHTFWYTSVCYAVDKMPGAAGYIQLPSHTFVQMIGTDGKGNPVVEKATAAPNGGDVVVQARFYNPVKLEA